MLLLLLKPSLYYVRASVLYYRFPYDLPIWSKIRNPWYYIFYFLGANPDIFVRGGFFTIYLLCIASDLEEFQVLRFILGMKGMQFVSGMIKSAILCYEFWACSVGSTDPLGCQVR